MKRYRWEISRVRTSGGGYHIKSVALGHKDDGPHFILRDTLTDSGVTPLPFPYRVSYTTQNLCEARFTPQLYGRRAWKVK